MISTIEEALQDLVSGKMIIVMDDEDRENEGDLVCAAELCTPDIINFYVYESAWINLCCNNRRACC